MTKKRTKKKIIINILITCLVILTVAVFLIYIFAGTGEMTRKAAVECYFKAVSNSDKTLYKKVCYPDKWIKNYNPGEGVTLDKVLENTFSEQAAAANGISYGNIKIISYENLKRSEIEKFNEGMKTIYGIDFSVSKIERVTMNVGVSDSNGNSGTVVKYIYKYHCKWYFLSDPLLLVNLNLDEK